jgi:hypothetical protein
MELIQEIVASVIERNIRGQGMRSEITALKE